jgi:hypothetical protein
MARVHFVDWEGLINCFFKAAADGEKTGVVTSEGVVNKAGRHLMDDGADDVHEEDGLEGRVVFGVLGEGFLEGFVTEVEFEQLKFLHNGVLVVLFVVDANGGQSFEVVGLKPLEHEYFLPGVGELLNECFSGLEVDDVSLLKEGIAEELDQRHGFENFIAKYESGNFVFHDFEVVLQVSGGDLLETMGNLEVVEGF